MPASRLHRFFSKTLPRWLDLVSRPGRSLQVREYVSVGGDQVVPIGAFEPVTVTATGYTAGDVPFPAPFPFELRQFGVRIEGLQGGPLVTFTKDAQTNGRGGGQVIPEPNSVCFLIAGLIGVVTLRKRILSPHAAW